MEYYRSFPSVTFAVPTVDQSVSTVLSRVDNRIRIATFLEEMAHFL